MDRSRMCRPLRVINHVIKSKVEGSLLVPVTNMNPPLSIEVEKELLCLFSCPRLKVLFIYYLIKR